MTPQKQLDKHIPDHDTRYEVTLTGVQLEAMRYLSNWALDVIGAQQLLPMPVIAASDCVFMIQHEIRRKAREAQGEG